MRSSPKRWLSEYGAFHKDPVNRAAHLVAFPLLFLGGFGLLSHVDAGLALVVLCVFAAVNVTIDLIPGIVCSVFALGAQQLGAPLPVAWLAAALAAGAGVGILGHIIFERRWPDSPARFARFEIVGHLWFTGWLLGTRK